jgi:hypothetical protein
MLELVYIVLTAKPVSIRRLCMLFVLSYVVTDSVLITFRIHHVEMAMLYIASVITLAAWLIPLMQLAIIVTKRGDPSRTLSDVSIPVQCSYAFVLVSVPIVLAVFLQSGLHWTGLCLELLLRSLAIACTVAPLFLIAIRLGWRPRIKKPSGARSGLGRGSLPLPRLPSIRRGT